MIGGILGVVISGLTLLGVLCGRIGGKAIANNKLDTLWTERIENQNDMEIVKTDVAVIKNDVARIKDFLDPKK